MIAVQDNFLPTDVFTELQQHCLNSDFDTIKAGDKEFLTIPTPKNIVPYLHAEGHDIILSFVRKAHKDFDTSPRVHADGIINRHRTTLASVLYINPSEGVTPNGTAFYEHQKWGRTAPNEINETEFDRLLTEDANDPEKWRETDRITAVPNRLLLYDANYFHAKWPNKIEQGERIVMVTFYAKNKEQA